MIEMRLASRGEEDMIIDLLNRASLRLHQLGVKDQWAKNGFCDSKDYFMDAIEAGQIYFACLNDQICGVVLIRYQDLDIWGPDDGGAGYIHHLGVDKRKAYPGLGKDILLRAEGVIRKSGRSVVRLDCLQTNRRLNQYYLDQGYFMVKDNIYEDGVIGRLYEKRLDE